MKTALMSLIVLASLNSFAATTLKYDVSAPRVVSSQYGVQESDAQFCPSFDLMVAQQDAQLNGVSLTFSQQKGVVQTEAAGASRGCQSDIVCPAEDSFKFLTAEGSASITRNNDGNYPTTDLPGYSDLSVYMAAPTKTGRVACYYSLTPAN